MYTGTNLDYIREQYKDLGKPVPKMLELLSEVYGQANGKSISGEYIYIFYSLTCVNLMNVTRQ